MYGSKRTLYVLLCVGLNVAVFLPLVYLGPVMFTTEGYNRPSIPFSDLKNKTIDGTPIRWYDLGRRSPDQAIRVYVESPAVVVKVEIVDAEGRVLYEGKNNGTLSAFVNPLHTSDIELRIAEICPCNYLGWEHVWYVEYSIFPWLELMLVLGGILAAVLLVVPGYSFRWFSPLIVVPVEVFLLDCYLYAFDIGGASLWIGVAVTAGIAVVSILARTDRTGQVTKARASRKPN
jgi:hypothetical protein